jgi:hypothetical protein
MIDYAKINLEYDKIHKRLDELEEKYQTTPIQRIAIDPINAAVGLPLHIRCFLLYRAFNNPNVKTEYLGDTTTFTYSIIYLDPYELPTVARKVFISFDEMVELWKLAHPDVAWVDRKPGWLDNSLFGPYLKKEGYLLDPS